MVDQKHSLFQRVTGAFISPERLDQLMQVVSPKSWLPLASLGSLVVVVSLGYGRSHHRRGSRGTDLPAQVVPSVKSSGQFCSGCQGWGCRKGEVLATVDQVDLRKQLQQLAPN